jgi:hypothetical protein
VAESPVKSPGQLLATMLAGSWRSRHTSFDCSAEDLAELAPLALRSGAAALCWRRIGASGLRVTPAARGLHQTYRRYALQAALQQESIQRVFKRLRAAGIEPILVKGWAVARLYPEQGLRQCGDIDLCFSPEQYPAAVRVLENLEDTRSIIDAHRGFERFGGGSFADFYDRSELIKCIETDVRVLSAEDHLRVLSIHLLREGAWRPLWLCDIAVAVESRSISFKWERCLSENERCAGWVLCAIRLAHKLLGAEISCTPALAKTINLPHWLIPTILREWESPVPSMSQRHLAPMANLLRHPSLALKYLRHHWPNPIEATINSRAAFNEFPRLPLQLGDCLSRTVRFAARLPKLLRER